MRQAHRKFTLPGAGAGKHEIGEIGARDQQDEAGDPEEQPEGGVVLLPQRADSISRRDSFEPEFLISLDSGAAALPVGTVASNKPGLIALRWSDHYEAKYRQDQIKWLAKSAAL